MNNPFLGVFDAPVLNTSCDRRKISVTALQALTMYDSEFVNDEAVHLAEKVRRESSSDKSEQVQRAFQLVLSRPPNAEEAEQAQSFFTETAAEAGALTGLPGHPDPRRGNADSGSGAAGRSEPEASTPRV